MRFPQTNAVVFEQHEPCPKCQKAGKDTRGNNLGRWRDGHAYCFSCGYRESSLSVKLLENVVNATKGQDGIKPQQYLTLPEDYTTTDFSPEGLQWLGKYDISREEIIGNKIGFSKMWNALIFAIYNKDGDLMAFQARRFNHVNKWTSHGNVSSINYILGKATSSDNPVVLVEDIVSAIKVSRFTRAMPIFMSYISPHRIMKLKEITKNLIIWLDSDKYGEAIRMAERAGLFDISPRVIYTLKDPKEYSNEEIQKYLLL